MSAYISTRSPDVFSVAHTMYLLGLRGTSVNMSDDFKIFTEHLLFTSVMSNVFSQTLRGHKILSSSASFHFIFDLYFNIQYIEFLLVFFVTASTYYLAFSPLRIPS